MPALGESVTEGTVTRWLKSEGDPIAVDEPLLEVSTDKVDTEIPSPVAGTLQKIVVGVDQTVAVGAELAIIEDGAAAPAAPVATPAPVAATPAPAPVVPTPVAPVAPVVPILARGGGTALAGQTVNHAVVVDFSANCREILQIDPVARRVRVEPGVVLDQLNGALSPHGLMFGADVCDGNWR
jgi:2-oxoglutarate dehydrogenase E2 component (dihydrolipoamide succinyltransferase)